MPAESRPGAYQGVSLVLAGAALAGSLGAWVGGNSLKDGALLDLAVTLWICGGTLFAVVFAERNRRRERGLLEHADPARAAPAAHGAPPEPPTRRAAASSPSEPAEAPAPGSSAGPSTPPATRLPAMAPSVSEELKSQIAAMGGPAGAVCVITALTAVAATLWTTWTRPGVRPELAPVAIGVGLCVLAAGSSALAARYLSKISPDELPEALGLTRLARVVAWVLVCGGVSLGFSWMGEAKLQVALRVPILLVNLALCYGLWRTRPKHGEATTLVAVPLDFGVLVALGNRPNLVASILDAAERQLGIDIRSSWALTVVRRSSQPVLLALALVGWLSTAWTRVGLQEEAVLERLGRPLSAPLDPGLHLHFPWPVDRAFRISTQRIQSLTVGHEGAAESGPENVLWARQHAGNEYTLLLGDGRELITVDAAVQYRIKDSAAWLYHSENPALALTAIAYRAVMRSTVDRTLADALSQNVVLLTSQMKSMVQKDADALGLGVQVVDFTVGGMHPPVPVAGDYQAVVSAELGRLTAAVEAQAYRNSTVPAAEASALTSANEARAEGETARGKAAGEAWAFRTVESEYRVSPADYVFRRRLETLENALHARSYTLIDARIEKQGGEFWLTP